jgi:sulfonate dioxygenase
MATFNLSAFTTYSSPRASPVQYTSQALNFQSLSPTMASFLRTLKATHTAVNSMRSKRGGVVRREPIESVHPVVRQHPAGEEALYVNR